MMYKFLATTMLIACASAPASAAWHLNNDDSALTFVSTKSNSVAEVLTFTNLQGHVDEDGTAELRIDLNSVDTAIEIRDQRMREVLFDTENFPAATLTMSVDLQTLNSLQPGMSTVMDNTAKLSLHGTHTELQVSLRIVRLSVDQLLVVSEKPVIVHAGSLDLSNGIDRLRELAGLPSISLAVPVMFVLSFEQEP